MMLYKSTTNRVLSGVCGGIAEAFDLSATGIRWLVVIASIFTGLPVLIYAILAIVLKNDPNH